MLTPIKRRWIKRELSDKASTPAIERKVCAEFCLMFTEVGGDRLEATAAR